MPDLVIKAADYLDLKHADTISELIAKSAKERGTGIAARSPEYISSKILENKAIIALTKQGELAGFCYIESWSHGKYIANSGLIVNPKFRKQGIAHKIKKKAFEHSRKLYPQAKIFGITTSLAVMKINSDLGYQPVTFSQLTTDKEFWQGCKSCVNYSILESKDYSNCLCTGMLFNPREQKKKKWSFMKKSRIYERLVNIKKAVFTKQNKSKAL